MVRAPDQPELVRLHHPDVHLGELHHFGHGAAQHPALVANKVYQSYRIVGVSTFHPNRSLERWTLDVMNHVFTVVFTIEMVFKVGEVANFRAPDSDTSQKFSPKFSRDHF